MIQNPDCGDTTAQWPCRGSATIDLPASVVARWAPGGSVVEHVDERRCTLTIGGWSWMGVAGLFVTFDADLYDIEPVELGDALRQLAVRLRRAQSLTPRGVGSDDADTRDASLGAPSPLTNAH